ncbi:preprotein translocase subunit YajC [Propionimicrobium sp. PCR01-08-3]|uniref:preprotein translocase subunit YajC n=1 Tax=Propionimicrobium sp. PCR01-08-3 TaxID=3052086 RepID=UPI00255CB880|nr:preprotein translocase subunit YajC [Propionimicrobium sp. PCR01-08-3]WIY83877.1 preprotein translocase subunit YajC [Propionimicrobium sp. PCR01-08-3]
MEILLILAVFIGLMYFMTIRPQKKRMDEQRKMLEALQPGARVLLNSGIFGTIRATGEQQMVVELAPGTEVTVLKQTVARVANPDEEEFEYSDTDTPEALTDTFSSDEEPGAVAPSDDLAFQDPDVETAFRDPDAITGEAAEVPPASDDDVQSGDVIYRPGENSIYQAGQAEENATDDAGERPTER